MSEDIEIHHPPMSGLQGVTVPFSGMRLRQRLKFVVWVLFGKEITFCIPGMTAHIRRVTQILPPPPGVN